MVLPVKDLRRQARGQGIPDSPPFSSFGPGRIASMQWLRLLIVCSCMLPTVAQAQVRAIPEQAKDGEMRHVQETLVSINGVQMRLAPGAQIRDEANRLIVPTALPAGAKVKYLLDSEGLVRQVWILSPQEAPKNN